MCPSQFDTSFLTDDLFAAQYQHQERMLALLSGCQPDRVPTFDYAAFQLPTVGPYQPERWLAEALHHFRVNLQSYCDPVTWRIPGLALCRYGLHFTSAVLGCSIREVANQPWCKSLAEMGQSPQDFRIPNLDENAVFQDILRSLRFFADATQCRLPIELPFLAEPLLAAVDLFGSEFLILLAQEDELADSILADISSCVLMMRSQLHAAVPEADLRDYHTCACPMPNGYTFVHGCSTHLVSAQTYRKHVAELDSMHLTHQANGGCLHLCGKHTQHLPVWRDMPGLRALQLNDDASVDLEHYWRELRQDQFIVVWVGTEMPWQRAVRLTHGRRLAIRHSCSVRIQVES